MKNKKEIYKKFIRKEKFLKDSDFKIAKSNQIKNAFYLFYRNRNVIKISKN